MKAITVEGAVVYHGSNLDVLPTLPDNSVDSIVTDPPYELGFMGKSWDSSGIAYSVELWAECLRVLKPGGHLLAFSGSRTYHRMVVAIEDAGFEIRDMVSWISNKTFPKSMNISKAIDKAAGAEREVIGSYKATGTARNSKHIGAKTHAALGAYEINVDTIYQTAATTDEAKQWEGWGTALKPTVEPIVMARKPVEGTVANNVLTYGVGGINIDASRIGTETITTTNGKGFASSFGGGVNNNGGNTHEGRWPANVIFDEDSATLLDEQSGISKPSIAKSGKVGGQQGLYENGHSPDYVGNWPSDNGGGASRFFYVARASKADRNEGLENLPKVMARNYAQDKTTLETMPFGKLPKENFHPTVKPTTLMEYLIKLVTPEGGTVLDPFTGSGSTGKAALLNGYQFIGIELTEEYLPIIEGRLKWAYDQATKAAETPPETTLF